ncbi:MAG: hypothetical protein JW760_05780 [Spirochaetales bacterium]|nr:hypothetical protein [Spirochaetales bacterium]
MNIRRTFCTVSCFFILVTTAAGNSPAEIGLAFLSEVSAEGTVSAATGFTPGLQASGTLRLGGSLSLPGGFGMEASAGLSGKTPSFFLGSLVYTAYSGLFGTLELLWQPEKGPWGILSGFRGDFMTLSLTDHTFFFPSLSAGVCYSFPADEDQGWNLRLCLKHTQHFRKDLAFSSSTGIGLAILQGGGTGQ